MRHVPEHLHSYLTVLPSHAHTRPVLYMNAQKSKTDMEARAAAPSLRHQRSHLDRDGKNAPLGVASREGDGERSCGQEGGCRSASSMQWVRATAKSVCTRAMEYQTCAFVSKMQGMMCDTPGCRVECAH